VNKITEELGCVASIRTGFLVRKSVAACATGSHLLLQLRDFNADRTQIHVKGLVRFDPGSVPARNNIKPDDVIFLAKGTGNFAFHPGPLPAPTLAASCFAVLTPRHYILPDYLVWFLNHPRTRDAVSKLGGTASRMPVISKSQLAAIKILVPSLETQRAIVQLQQSAADEARLLDELKQSRSAYIAEATMRLANSGSRSDEHV
jgi:hypothetical protein